MNIVDSSGWLEYFSDGRNASRFAVPLKDLDSLVVPTVSIYEVFKVLLRESGEEAALQAASAMQRGHLVDFTPQRALSAATFSLKHSLPMADSIIGQRQLQTRTDDNYKPTRALVLFVG